MLLELILCVMILEVMCTVVVPNGVVVGVELGEATWILAVSEEVRQCDEGINCQDPAKEDLQEEHRAVCGKRRVSEVPPNL